MTAASRLQRSVVEQQGEVVSLTESQLRRASRPPVLAAGGQIGRYVLVDKLGQGSFGLVFSARDTVLDRMVAIKILNPAHQYNADVLRRFLQEALASARVVHPGVVTIHDFGTVPTSAHSGGETAYIVLELLQGESLSSRVERTGRLPVAWAVEIIRQVASALDTAHRAGVLHRDLKSENIYLVADPAAVNGERVKVLDFGLAKVGASQHTQMNTVFGTPRYMSPEQCRSATSIDARSDIYSLGCVFFELITGRTPFTGDLRTLLEAHKRAMPPRASQLVPDLPHAVDELIARMLAKDPAERPQTMAALHAMLYQMNAAALAAHAPATGIDAASSAAFTTQMAVAPGVAVTIPPTPAEMLAMQRPQASPIAQLSLGQASFGRATPMPGQPAVSEREPRRKSKQQIQAAQHVAAIQQQVEQAAAVVGLPNVGSVKYHLAPHLPSLKRSPVRASIIGAAITFLIAAVLTAIAARGHVKAAAAEPPPASAPAN